MINRSEYSDSDLAAVKESFFEILTSELDDEAFDNFVANAKKSREAKKNKDQGAERKQFATYLREEAPIGIAIVDVGDDTWELIESSNYPYTRYLLDDGRFYDIDDVVEWYWPMEVASNVTNYDASRWIDSDHDVLLSSDGFEEVESGL